MTSLSGKRIVLGITGSIAAYKAAELTRLLVKHGATVDVVLTSAAEHFIGAATFQALTGRPAFCNLWDNTQNRGMTHIDLVRGADVVLVAPASADFLAKVTHG
ncbi:MAG: flavoprotein, partial [Rhodocyclaceae bacterium]|nr:flavoprotein [Rhodocyclaceae bacterium]